MLKKIVAISLITVLLCSNLASAEFSMSIGFGYMQDNLSAYGTWASVGNYGQCFVPSGVGANWRPYYYGHWANSDVGWVWVSNEPFGWATYHYGRWVFDPYYGWVWVPGSVWAPAWVSWRVGPSYIGWYPLGPEGCAIAPIQACVFVPCGSFLSVNVWQSCVPAAQNYTVINNTNVINNITVVNNNTVINRGPSVATVQAATGRPVPTMRLVNQTNGTQSSLRGNQLAVYRPTVQAAPGRSTPLLSSENRGRVWTGSRAAMVHPTSTAPANNNTFTRPAPAAAPHPQAWHPTAQPNANPAFHAPPVQHNNTQPTHQAWHQPAPAPQYHAPAPPAQQYHAPAPPVQHYHAPAPPAQQYHAPAPPPQQYHAPAPPRPVAAPRPVMPAPRPVAPTRPAPAPQHASPRPHDQH